MTDVRLLLLDPEAPVGGSTETAFGGAPPVADGFTWPACASCGVDMLFLGQIRRSDAARLLLVFMCGGDGPCREWEPDAGGNVVFAVGVGTLHVAEAAPRGTPARPRYGAQVELVQAENYNAARTSWDEQHPGRRREVLGQLGGVADWLQDDETPVCDACRQPMTLAAQLESGPEFEIEMIFGGGCGYVFDCACQAGTPKFLFQC